MDNFLEQFNDINTEQTFVQNEVEKHKALAILAYIFPFLCWLPTVAGDKNSTYCKFHANQSLTWLITMVVVNIVRLFSVRSRTRCPLQCSYLTYFFLQFSSFIYTAHTRARLIKCPLSAAF